MKQTNNAIKFLMAQYRAIFKNANIAMVAAMAAAALAAGSANATQTVDGKWDVSDFSNAHDNADIKAETINKDSALNVDDITAVNATFTYAGNNEATKIEGAKVNITGAAHKHIAVANLALTNNAQLTITNTEKANTSIFGYASDKAAAGDGNVGTLTVNSSKINATGAGFAFNYVDISNGSEITLGGVTPGNVADNVPAWVVYANIGASDNAKDTAGQDGILKVTDSTVNLKDQSNIVADNKVALDGATINFTGKFLEKEKHATSFIRGAVDGTGTVALTKGTKLDASAGHGAIFSDKIDIQSASANIGDGNTLTLDGDWAKKDKDNVSNHNKSTITIKDFTTNGTGSLILGNEASGATVTISGSTTINSKLVSHAAVEVSGAAATLEVSSDKIANDNGLFASASGTLTLSNGGTLKINDATNTAKPFDIAGLTFADGTAAQNSVLIKTNGSIVGDNLAMTEKKDHAAGLTVKAKNLTLGKADATLADKLGVKALEAENVTFINKDADFNLLEDLTLSTAGTGTINGGLKIGKTGSGATVTISGGSYTFESGKNLETDATGKLVIDKASKLDASGVGNLKLAVGGSNAATVQLKGGSTLVLDQTDVFKKGSGANDIELVKDSSGSNITKEAISSDATSVLEFKLSDAFKDSGGKFTMSKTQVENVKNALADNGLDGVISFGNNFVLSGLSGSVALNDVIENADVYDGNGVKAENGTVDRGVVAGNISIGASADKATISTGKNVILYNAGNSGFVSKGGKAAAVALSGTASLTLAGSGSIGAIDGGAANEGSVVIGHSKKETSAVVAESIGDDKGVKSVDLQGKSTLTLTKENAQLKTQVLNVGDNASLVAEKQDIIVTSSGTSGSSILGDVTAKSLKFDAGSSDVKYEIAGDAVVDVDTLTMTASGSLFVGKDGTGTSAGHLEVGTLALHGGKLIVDPEWNADASIAHIKSMGGNGGSGDAIQLDGKLGVGKNSVLGFGFDSAQEVKDLFTTYGYMTADGKKLNKDKIQAALVLNKPLEIAADQGVMIDPSKTGQALKDAIDPANPPGTAFENKFVLGTNAGLVITDGAYKIDQDGKKTGSAVSFAAASGEVSGDGKVVLAGYFTGADKDITIFSGSGLNGSGTVDLVSLNGLITAKVDLNTGKIQAGSWTFDKDNKLDTYYTSASKPVSDLLKDVMSGTIKGNTIGYKFLGKVANSDDKSGVLADAAAHAATYAGAQQAAVASVTTMADAMFGRVGAVGVEAASIAATGSQANGGVWLTPMYKSMDSDGFNAEGASYGSDVDLSGVAFGADTVNGNMRFGAVFNIGSGDAEGKGNGNGLKDEFDYYGFGIYSAMGFGNFALVGDASMTVISHDVEGHGLKGKADTTAVTMGVTGQYSIATPVVDVTPHLGARFIRLNTDSYDLISAKGVVATTDFDVQNVFSVPVGVTLSKGFVAGGWTLAPSADLTVAFNTGDTEAKSQTTFTGVKGINLSTEVLDEVQYGVNLGLGTQYGAFGTSFGINYTGSSNTNSFGVNAQARYMF
ncbi:autotransporter outer membrane beta-barrel domain-containing protein [Anaerobiospirillum succiniciproducens]|uniref:autotransporter outer membrane beta-barrel domain-containing protein n=1 Tax=Anaerobiospirillum succiniciproducens TaxID=13335 RepID=UPI0004028313|nr:autotransporter outer membrane beta-barrel domain-containing protein [Anaerobiospirillum succiniciproducens]